MTADRRINSAGQVQFRGSNHLLIKRLPHAVESLKLIPPLLARHDLDCGNAVGVMGCELRIKQISIGQHELGASEIAYIG